MAKKKHNNGILEFKNEECKRLFQSALYKCTEDSYLPSYMSYIYQVSHTMGFYPTTEEVKSSAIALMKRVTEHIKEPETILIKLGPTWGGVILSIWMAEANLEDENDNGLSILATILRELDYLKEKLSKI